MQYEPPDKKTPLPSPSPSPIELYILKRSPGKLSPERGHLGSIEDTWPNRMGLHSRPPLYIRSPL